jgi:hypothetical protein
MMDKNKIWVDHFFHKVAPFLSVAILTISVVIFTHQVLAMSGSNSINSGPNLASQPTLSPTPKTSGSTSSPIPTQSPKINSEFQTPKPTLESTSKPSPFFTPKPSYPPLKGTSRSGEVELRSPKPSSLLQTIEKDVKKDEGTVENDARRFEKLVLKEDKLKICQVRSEGITKRSKTVLDALNKKSATLQGVALGVENYYLNTIVASGSSVSNYDSLVSDINTKKSNLDSAIKTTQDDINNFSCSENNPPAQLNQFKLDTQNAITALSEYKKSIKNLISAIRAVAPSTKKENEQK